MQFIKRPIVLLYKGYKSSVNYDGEPSVSKGIASQLPSSHLFIHRVSAKLSNRVMPYGEITFSFSADVKGQVYDRLVTINYGRITDSFTVSK